MEVDTSLFSMLQKVDFTLHNFAYNHEDFDVYSVVSILSKRNDLVHIIIDEPRRWEYLILFTFLCPSVLSILFGIPTI